MKSSCNVVTVVAALAIAASGCDPGWHYEVEGLRGIMENGLRFEIPGPPQTRTLVYASMFAGALSADIRITRIGDVDLIFTEEARLTVINAAGSTLPEESSVVWCSEHQVSVNRKSGLGETCLVSATFGSGVTAAELGEISILLEGLRLHDSPSSVKVRMRRMP